ncbi:D-galactarolactone cycloisomerase [subsurface metagenome]
MKIKEIEAIPIKYPLKKTVYWAQGPITERRMVLVKVKTDENIVGIGEAAIFGGPNITTKTIVEEELSKYVIGENPMYPEKIWEKMYIGTMQHGRRGVAITGMSGIDIAIWDLIGKIKETPLYQLLGGFKDKVKPYASAGFYTDEVKDIERLSKKMAGFVRNGFTAVKMKLGRDPESKDEVVNQYKAVSRNSLELDFKRVKAVRKAIGGKTDLLVDPNNMWNVKTTIKMVNRLKDQNLYFIEEPIPTDDKEGLKIINSSIDIPVAGCETAYTRHEFKELIVNRCVDIVQPGVTWAGGMTEARKIAIMASAHNMLCIPHSYNSAIDLAAAIHLTCSIPNSEYVEYDQTDGNALTMNLINNPFGLDKEGFVKPSNKPGLGIELNDKFIEKYREGV